MLNQTFSKNNNIKKNNSPILPFVIGKNATGANRGNVANCRKDLSLNPDRQLSQGFTIYRSVINELTRSAVRAG